MWAVRVLLFLFLGCLFSCKPRQPPTPPENAAAEARPAANASDAPHRDESGPHLELPTRVRLSSEVVAAAGIRTAAVREARLSATVEIVGEVAADPDRAARVAARLSGRVTSVHAREGERVKAGALLCVLESPELSRTRATLLSAQARSQSAAENAERLQSLAGSGAASRQEATAANAELAAIRAEASAAEQTLRTFGLPKGALALQSDARLEVRAPIEGFVVARNATLGQTVMLEHVLFELVNLDEAYFIGRLFEKNLARVEPGAAAEVRLNAYPDDVFFGKVESIGKQLDPTARTVVARIRIVNQKDHLKVGLFGTARVISSEPVPPESHLLVPLGALIRVAEREVVFVRQPDGDFEVHPVILGRTAAGQAEVLSGLRVGEQVVVEGAFTLKSAILRSTLGED